MGTAGHPGLCDPCTARAADWLAELPGLWIRLHLRMPAGQATGERVSGSGEAPAPARVDVLSFVGPANPGDRLDLPGDDRERAQLAALQIGDIPMLGRLNATVQAVCEQMAVTRPAPAPLPDRAADWPYGPPTWAQAEAYRRWREHTRPHRQTAAVLDFLTRWHRWLTSQPWADSYAQELHDVWQRAKTLTGEWNPRPEPCDGVTCPRCDAKTIYRNPGQDGRRCDPHAGGCGLYLDDTGYERWTGLSAHWAKEAG
jgi:hypothetical protein